MNGEYDRSIRDLSTSIEMNSHYAQARVLLAIVYVATGDYTRALIELQRAATMDNTSFTAGLTGLVPALSGDQGSALKLVQHLLESPIGDR